MLPNLIGDGQRAQRYATIFNSIVAVINRDLNNPNVGSKILYLGHEQKLALCNVEASTAHTLGLHPFEKKFGGWRIIWVHEDDYTRFV